MVITENLYSIRCKVGNSVKPRLIIVAADMESAINDAQVHWADQEGYDGADIVPVSTSVIDLDDL